MIFQFIIFLSLVLIILLGAHGLLYWATMKLFNLSNPLVKNIWLLILLFLAASFFLSSILARTSDSFFARTLYFISGTWLGILNNLLLGLLLGVVIIAISKITGFSFRQDVLMAILALGVLVFSAYGVWNAFHPTIRKVAVSIPGLPNTWQDRKIVQISDVHLGTIRGEAFMERISAQINTLRPDIIFITGDLFDGMDKNLDEYAAAVNQLHAPLGVYFITGNHETYVGTEKVYAALEKNSSVKILKDEMVTIDGLQILGISYPQRGFSKNISQLINSFSGYQKEQPAVLLYHSPTETEQAKEAGINLQLSGHTHRGQLFPFNFITSLIFKGNDHGLHSSGNYSIYTSVGTGTWGPPMRTNSRSEITLIDLK